jgi:hypothetical protein
MMIMKSISQPQKFTITGFALPYFVIILMAGIIISQPGTADEKTTSIGFVAFILPLIAAFIGAILVGIGSIKKEKIETKRKSLVHAFVFGFLWTAVFHFFITLYLFMQIVYVYAGLKH